MLFYQVLEQFSDSIFFSKVFGFNFYTIYSSSFLIDFFEKSEFFSDVLVVEEAYNLNKFNVSDLDLNSFILENFREELLGKEISILKDKEYFNKNTSLFLLLKLFKDSDFLLPENLVSRSSFYSTEEDPLSFVETFDKIYDIQINNKNTFFVFGSNFLKNLNIIFDLDYNCRESLKQSLFFKKFLNQISINYVETLEETYLYLLEEFFLEKNQCFWLILQKIEEFQSNLAYTYIHLYKAEFLSSFKTALICFMDDCFDDYFYSYFPLFKSLSCVNSILGLKGSFFSYPFKYILANLYTSTLLNFYLISYKFSKIYFYIILSCFFIYFFFLFSKPKTFQINNFWSIGQWNFFVFIFQLLKEQSGIRGILHLPLIFSIFFFIIFNNLVGLLPYSYTITSHIFVTFFLGFSTFVGITILICVKKGWGFFDLFLPKGVPAALVPFLFVIEVVSYIFRTISISVRLFANMMAGHALLHILSNFGVVIFSSIKLSRFFFIFPLLVVFIITFLEIGIAILQAYVFAVLLCIYFNDVYSLESH